jgi:hypothetical protein
MVDTAFSEWDKPTMLKNLQQHESCAQTDGHKTGLTALLFANNTQLLALALIIIPTISGVTLIA